MTNPPTPAHTAAPPLTLFGAPGSGSAAIEMALRAAGLAYTLVRAAPWEPDSAMPALLHANPLGQIPTLCLADGTVLTETAAILIHLGLAHAGSGLLPQQPSARAMALRGLVFIAANCYSAVSVSDYPARWTTATSAASHAKVRAGARVQLHRYWEVFADTFGAAPVFNSDSPGALEFLATVVSQWSGTRAHLRSTRPAFLASLEALQGHPRLTPLRQAGIAA